MRSDPSLARMAGVLGLAALAASPCAAQDFTWTGASSPNWFTSQNWSPMMVPTPGSSVLIPGASPLVQLGNGAQPILGVLTAQRTIQISGSVTVSDGTLTDLYFLNTGGMTSPFTVNGQLMLAGDSTNWNGGAFAGVGHITNFGTITLTSGGAKIIDGPRFENQGTVIQTGGSLELRAATFDNSGQFEVGPQSVYSGTGFESTEGFNNHGMLTKSTGAGASTFATPFFNFGEVNVTSGLLVFSGYIQQYNDATLRVGNGATIRISNPNAIDALEPTLGGTLTGAGDIVLQAGAITIESAVTADLSLDSPHGFQINVTGGDPEVYLDADIQNSGAAAFTFGRLVRDHALVNMPGGDLTIGASGTGGARVGEEASIHNQGSAVVLGTLSLADSAQVVNDAGASLELTSGSISGPPGTLVRSSGTIRKRSSATQGTSVSAPLVLEGSPSIEIESRELAITNGSWNASATVNLGGGTSPSLRLSTSNTFSGGENVVQGAGTLLIEQLTLAHGSLENRLGPGGGAGATVTGSIVSSSGTLINTGQLDWNGASLSGYGLDGAFINRNMVTCRGGLLDHGSIVNDAPGRFELVSGILNFSLGAGLTNAGTLVLNGGHLAGAQGSISNSGMLEKIGNGSTTVGPSFSNFGSVRVLAGSLTFSSLTNIVGETLAGGDWYAAPGATLNLPPGITTLDLQTYVRGSGSTQPWLPNVSEIRGDSRCTFDATTALNHQLQLLGNATVSVIMPDTTLTVPLQIENGNSEDVLSEIDEVFVPALDPPNPPMITTPVLNNHAVLVPGGHGAAGPFNLTGNLACFPTSMLDAELAGTSPPDFDQFSIIGSATLDGTLRIGLLNAFVPALGQAFPILNATGSVTGSFSRIDFPGLPEGAAARVRVLPHGAELRIVCRSDFNADHAVNSQDFFDFLGAFFASSPAADVNADNAVNSQDFFDFLGSFFAGC